MDRCRPDFAIRLIERIKHFFDIPRIVFVLVMDKTQFSKVVCHNYGYDERLGEEYLDKFVDFTVPLPNISQASSRDYIHHKVIQQLLGKVGETSEDICFIFYMSQYEVYLTPREIKRKINIYALLKQGNKSDMFLVLALVQGANELELKMLNIFSLIIIQNKYSYLDEVLDFLENEKVKNFEIKIYQRFGLKIKGYMEFINSMKNLVLTHKGSEDDAARKDDLREKLIKYNLFEVDDFNEFSTQFDDYIKSDLY